MQHSSYALFPGRQRYVGLVPRKYQNLFFEGVQSIDSTPNSEELNHGQYGFQSDVINERDYKNVSGTVSCKDFGWLQRVLRAMCDQDPDTSFIYDPARMSVVDVYENVYNKLRNAVTESSWFVDFVASVKDNSNLDEVGTADFDFTAKRKLTFSGYQIVTQSFVTTAVGQDRFTLAVPAIVDPVMESVTVHSPDGLVTGAVRHELCPVQYALRVWLDGNVVTDGTQISLVTATVGSTQVTTMHLKTPMPRIGQIVKVMYLVDGTRSVSASGITQAPVMVSALLDVDRSVVPNVWKKKLTATFSKSIASAALTALTAAEFTLSWVVGGTAYSWVPATIATAGAISRNEVELTFTGVPNESVGGAAPAPAAAGTTLPPATPAILSYTGTNIKDDAGLVSPQHVLNITGF